MSKRGRDDWRKNASRKETREPAVTRSWQPGQRTTKSATPGSHWSLRKHLKTAGVATLLIAITAFTIYIFMPGTPVNTHVIVFDLCKENNLFGVTSEAPNFETRKRGSFEWGGVTVENPESPASFEFSSDASDHSDRKNADVFVVYLHANIVAGDQGQYWCLVRNSTPDLENNQYVRLAILKDKISLLRKTGVPVVLIVDQPSGRLDWRLGAIKTQVNTELEKWTNEETTSKSGEKIKLGRLFVVSSCLPTESSAPGRNGLTAFGMIVSRAWSEAANVRNEDDGDRLWLQKKNNSLTLAEFCDHVKSETHEWVSRYRRPSGQTVKIFRSSADVKTGPAGSLSLLGEPQDDPLLSPPRISTIHKELNQLWEAREDLDERLAWKWAPQSWQSANEYLRGAQNALLDGNSDLVKRLTKKANDSLNRLAQQARAELASKVDQPTGMPHCWATGLPATHRLEGLSKTVGNQAPKQTTIENVLATNVNEYPFDELDIVGTESAKEYKNRIAQVLKTNRTNAEDAVAQLISVTALLRPTTLAAEQKLLSLEDHIFIEQQIPPDSTDDWTALQEFAKAHQEAELAFQRALSRSESLARWAASQPIDPDLQPNLLSNLKNVCDTHLAESLWKNNEALPLQSEILRLLITAWMTGTLLWPDTPDHIDSLAKQTTTLVHWTKNIRTSQSNVSTLLGKRVYNLTTPVTNPLGYAAYYQELRAILDVAPMSSNDRKQLVENLFALDSKDSDFGKAGKPNHLPSAGDAEAAAEQATGTPLTQSTLWQLQYLSLFRPGQRQGDNTAPDHLSLATKIIADAVKEPIKTGVVLSHTNRATFGAAIRSFWRDSRKTIRKQPSAVNFIDNLTAQFRRDDLISRGLSAYDVSKAQSNPTHALHALWQIDYCLLHAERLLMGQWIEPAARKQAVPWYAKQAKDWITAAKSRANESTALKRWHTSVNERISLVENKLTDSRDKWSLSANPSQQNIAISDGEKHDVLVGLAVNGTLPSDVRGTAALQYLQTVRAQDPTAGTANLITFEHKVQAFELPLTAPNRKNESNHVSYIGEEKTRREGCENIDYTTRVFFRGRNWPTQDPSAREASRLTINWCTPASFLVTQNKRPPTASVRLSGTDKRKIVFVLDMSDSMKEPLKVKSDDGHTKRYELAISTLKKVTADKLLRTFGEQSEFAMLVFGQRVHRRDKGVYNTDFENLFDRGIDTRPTNGMEDIEWVFPLKSHSGKSWQRLNNTGKNDFDEVLNLTEKAGPFGITPLATAIDRAINKFKDDEYGLVIAITDGFALDVGRTSEGKKPDQGSEAETQTRAFDRREMVATTMSRHPNVKAHIIALDMVPSELAELQSVFTDLAEQINGDSIPVSSASTDDDSLRTRIMDSLPSRQYNVARKGWSKPTPFGTLVSDIRPDTNYTISYENTNVDNLNDVSLSPGDSLNVNVDWKQNRFRFKDIFPDEGKRLVVDATGGDRRKDAANRIRMLITRKNDPGNDDCDLFVLKLMLDHGQDFRPVRQPGEIEFQLLPTGLHSEQWPTTTTEEFTGHWGAPGYIIKARGWPKEPTPLPRIRVYWKMERTHPDATVTLSDLFKKNSPYKLPRARKPNLPAVVVTVAVVEGVLQVRLNPNPTSQSPDINFSDYDPADVRHVRVELGTSDVEDEFVSVDDVETTIQYFEDGHVTYEFHGDYANKLVLKNMKLGFTSGQSRWNDDAYSVVYLIQSKDIIEEAAVID